MKKSSAPDEQRIDLAPLTFRADVRPGSADAEARTVEVVFSVGAAVQRSSWLTGERWIEKLSMDPKHVKLDRLNNSAPFLNTHSAWSLSDVLGVIEPGTARIEKGQALATVRFSKRADVEPIWRDVQDGIIRNVSVGYRVHKYEQIDGADGKLPTRTAIDWEPFEISAVPMGADDGAKVRADVAKADTNPCVIITRAPEDTMKPDTTTAAEAQPADKQSTEVSAAARAEGAQAERERVLGIQRAVRAARLEVSVADDMITKGTSLDAARAAVLEQLAQRDEATPTSQHTPVAVIAEDEQEKWQRGASAWLFQKAGVTPVMARAIKASPDEFAGIVLAPGEFRGLSMIDLARESLERRGVRTRALDKMRLVGLALTHRAPGVGMQSSSDFAVLLENVMHKVLLAAYGTTPDTWSRFCATGTVSDFRAHNRYRLGTFGRLDTLNQSGEFKNKTIPDGEKQTITATTRGNIIGLTRQAIINDDMGSFSQLATMFGRAARLSIEMDVYEALQSNSGLGPTLNDGLTLFHADHDNIADAADLSVDGLENDRIAMAQQTDPSGNEILDLRPAVLVVPIGIGGDARVINESQFDPGVQDQQNRFMVPNKVRGLFRDIIDSPRLTDATRRYLFADPGIAPVLEVAFLDGMQAPFLDNENGWRIDGVEWKVRLDYGVGAVDFRGAVTNEG